MLRACYCPTMACTHTKLGHAVHYLQVRHGKTQRPVRLSQADCDGWVVFDDGSRYWNHDPVSLVQAVGGEVATIDDQGVLRGAGGIFSLSPYAWPLIGDELGSGPIKILTAFATELIDDCAVRARVKAEYEATR